jgi:hypothetical protein
MLAELIKVSTLIIWDEAPMTHRHYFEALDRNLSEILAEDKPGNTITLLQNMFVLSAGKVSLVSALQADTIYTIQKRRSF